MDDTPNPFHLPAKERARCKHIERLMVASGRYSTCPECFKEGVRRAVKRDPMGVSEWFEPDTGEA